MQILSLRGLSGRDERKSMKQPPTGYLLSEDPKKSGNWRAENDWRWTRVLGEFKKPGYHLNRWPPCDQNKAPPDRKQTTRLSIKQER